MKKVVIGSVSLLSIVISGQEIKGIDSLHIEKHPISNKDWKRVGQYPNYRPSTTQGILDNVGKQNNATQPKDYLLRSLLESSPKIKIKL